MADIIETIVDSDGFAVIPDASSDGTASPIVGTLDPASEAPRKRGRPVGSGKKPAGDNAGTPADSGAADDTRTRNQKESTGKKSPLAVGDLSQQLQAMHKMASLVLKNPLIEIEKGEADKLAQALSNVAKHYDFKVNPAVMAWAQLIGVGAAVYGPRVAFTVAAKKAQKQSSPVAQPQAPKMQVTPAQPGQMVYQ